MDRTERIRAILSTRSLTLYRISRQSAQIFGRSSTFFLPHNLCHGGAGGSPIPTIQQMLALSHITNYRLVDWLAVFGFDLDQIPHLRLLIPRKRTVLLDSSVYDTQAWISWFVERPQAGPMPSIAPLGQFLHAAPPKRASDILALNRRRFLYGKVGDQDSYALPHLAPGSIVRVDVQRSNELFLDAKTKGVKPFFLVEHESGYSCSRLRMLTGDRVLLYATQNPCAQRELRLGKNAQILGVVDAEFRCLLHRPTSPVSPGSSVFPKPRRVHSLERQTSLRLLLRESRLSAGLSFREASSASRFIATKLSDELHFTAAGTLSDYETLSAPPRHIQKIITLCVLYGIEFWQFLRASGLRLDEEGREPMPDELVPRTAPGQIGPARPGATHDPQQPPDLVDSLMQQWEEIPLFLTSSLRELTGLKNFSLSDVFWVGGDKSPLHPLLVGATLVAVNRRVKKPMHFPGQTLCAQPLYLILRRDGTYLCGHCILDQGNLVLPGYPGGSSAKQQLRNASDAEIVGQVTTVLRRLVWQRDHPLIEASHPYI